MRTSHEPKERYCCMTQPGEKTQETRSAGGLLPGPRVEGYSIQRDEGQHAFLINQTLVHCTPTEYHILELLLEQADRCVSYAQLSAHVQGEPVTDPAHLTHTRTRIIHLMSDLRAKIWALGLDIAAVMNTGYILLSSRTHAPASLRDRGHPRDADGEEPAEDAR
jgi:DNA-binding winged helix-turn-helix (wHTH) protein